MPGGGRESAASKTYLGSLVKETTEKNITYKVYLMPNHLRKNLSGVHLA